MLNKRYMDVLKNLDGFVSGVEVIWNEEYELAIRYAIDTLESTSSPQDETNNVTEYTHTMYDDLMAKNARNSFYGVYRNRYNNYMCNLDIRHPLHPYLDTESLTNIREHVLEKIIKPINYDSRFEPTEDLIKELVYLYSVCVLPNEFTYDKEHDFMYLGTINSSKTYDILDLIGNIIYRNVIDVKTRNTIISRTGYRSHSKWMVFWYKGSTVYVAENKLTLNFNGYLDVIKDYINNGDKRIRDNVTIREKYNTVELLIDTTNMKVNYGESFGSLIDTYKYWYKQTNQKELELTKDPYLVVIKDFIK